MSLARCLLGLVMAWALVQGSAPAQEKNSDIDFQIVKYEGLKDAVLKNRGQVVVVDFWRFD